MANLTEEKNPNMDEDEVVEDSENDEVVEDGENDDELEEENNDYSNEPDEIAYEQAIEWKRKAERLEKAEKKLVSLKKKLKENRNLSEYYTIDDLKIERFLIQYPEMEDFKNELKAYLDKWISLEEAKILIDNSDRLVKKNKINQINVSTNDWEPTKKVYTKSELAKLSFDEYNKVKDLADDWKVVIKWW